MVFHTFVEGSLMTAASRRVVIVTVEPTDHQAVLETLSRHHGTRAAAAAAVADGRIVRLHPLRRGHDHVDALGPDVGGLIVVAEYDTGLRDAAIALCSAAREKGICVWLVRRAFDDCSTELSTQWPRVAVNAVMDLGRHDDRPTIDVIAHAVAVDHASRLPCPDGASGTVDVLYGDRRRTAFVKALEEGALLHRVFGLAPAHTDNDRDLPVLRFRSRQEPQWTSSTFAVEYDALSLDPRSWDADVVPADDIEQQATCIAALHVGHGSWPATLAAVDACANGVLQEGRHLLRVIAQKLREPRASTFAGLRALAAANPACRWPAWMGRPPGHEGVGVAFTPGGRAAFWRAVDDDDDDENDHENDHELKDACLHQTGWRP
jgi:hypothetical protein